MGEGSVQMPSSSSGGSSSGASSSGAGSAGSGPGVGSSGAGSGSSGPPSAGIAAISAASAGGGAVSVVMNARPKISSITISPEVVDADDVEMLEDLITAALNEALEKIRLTQMQQLAGLAGGLNIPGLTT